VINWTDVAPALVNLISSLSLDDPPQKFQANWAHKSQKMVVPEVGMDLLLRVTSVVGVGEDETRKKTVTITPTEGDPYPEVFETVVGHRKFVLEVRVESQVHEEEKNRWAMSMLDRIRTRMRRTHSVEALQRVNVALLKIGASNDVTFKADKRKINAAVMDMTFYAAFCDEDPVAIGWFEKIKLTARIRGVDDELLDSPPNFTDELIQLDSE
jgi:hypothetical protein